jgi:hypothetical protein
MRTSAVTSDGMSAGVQQGEKSGVPIKGSGLISINSIMAGWWPLKGLPVLVR